MHWYNQIKQKCTRPEKSSRSDPLKLIKPRWVKNIFWRSEKTFNIRILLYELLLFLGTIIKLYIYKFYANMTTQLPPEERVKVNFYAKSFFSLDRSESEFLWLSYSPNGIYKFMRFENGSMFLQSTVKFWIIRDVIYLWVKTKLVVAHITHLRP